MTMFDLALRSLRFRAGGFLASFLALFLGATILMAFASLLETGTGDGVPAASRETLFTMTGVVGGFGLVIVVFAVTSTLTLPVRQRAAELALLKNVGATPGQIGRMIVGETALVAVAAALAAILPALFVGRGVLELLAATDQVAVDVAFRFGPIAIGSGLGITSVAATLAATWSARAAGRMGATESLLAASIEGGRLGRKRRVAAALFLAIGVILGVVTATVFRGKGYDAMQTAGQAGIWATIGFALLAPALVRVGTGVLAGPLGRGFGADGYLALLNLRQRPGQLASILMPIVLFTGIATGTLYMQAIENRATAAEGVIKSTEQRNIETLNYVVVGMLVLFAAIMLINTLVAATTYRGREFGQQRLVGSTPRQVLWMVGIEGIVLSATGVLFGSLASLVTMVPYSIARTSAVIPDAPLAIWLGIVAVAALITLGASLGATCRAIRTPAVEAVAA